MAQISPCPSVHCNDGPCRLAAEHVIAGNAEVPPECPNRVHLADPQLQLEPLLNGSDLHVTPLAGLLLSSRPAAGRPKLIASLVESNLLVLLAPRTPIAWRGMPAPAAVRDVEPEGPAPAPVAEKSWIKIRVVDDASDASIPNVKMLFKLPNGQEREFATRADGMIDVQDIDPGACDVSCSREDAELDQTLDFVAMGETSTIPEQEEGGNASQTTIPSGTRVLEIEEHRVGTGETLESVAQAAGLTWQELTRFNWGTIVPERINEHLRDDVGCTQRTADDQNYVFSDSDEPGIILVPNDWSQTGLATEQTHTIRVRSLGGAPTSLRIRLFDSLRRPIADAPYALHLGDRTLRGQADSDGWLAVEDVATLPETCRVEWGWPSESPPERESAAAEDSEFVFELEVFLNVDDADSDESTRRRLHNLGYVGDDDLDKATEQLKKDQHLSQTAGSAEAKSLVERWHDEVNPEPRRFEEDAPPE